MSRLHVERIEEGGDDDASLSSVSSSSLSSHGEEGEEEELMERTVDDDDEVRAEDDDDDKDQRGVEQRLQQTSPLGEAAHRGDTNLTQLFLFSAAFSAQVFVTNNYLLTWTDQVFLLLVAVGLSTAVLVCIRKLIVMLLEIRPALYARSSGITLGFVDFAVYVAAGTFSGLLFIYAAPLVQTNAASMTLALVAIFSAITETVLWVTSTFGTFGVTALHAEDEETKKQKKADAQRDPPMIVVR